MNKAKQIVNFKFPTFLKSFASTFDITGQTMLDIPDFNTGFWRDAKALQGDWQMIGNDIRKSMDSFANG